MTTLNRIKGNVFVGLFGEKAGTKLMNWLDPCCNTFCDDINTCLGISSAGSSTSVLNQAGVFVPLSVRQNTATAVNVTGDVTAAQLAGGLITSTSAAAVTATLPTATLLATQLGAVRGTVFDFVVDNSAGANTVTVAVNTGITVGTAAITGGDTLTVSTANKIAVFKLVFTSTTTAILRRTA